jgi:ammonium transporter Rh
MSNVRDLRREHFSDLPEPVADVKVKHEILGDKYMDALERYINQLSLHIRKIQDEELMVTNQFSLALSSLQTKAHEKRRMREDVAREVYQKKIAKIREKRKRFREMLYDAQSERKKLIDSMQIQKDEDDILRRKLAKLSALSASETSREQRQTAKFDKFGLLFVLLQVGLFIIYGFMFDFAGDSTLYNGTATAPGSTQPVAPLYQFFIDIMLMAVVGFGFLFSFLRKYSHSAIGFTLLTVAFAFQWGVVVMNFINSLAFKQETVPGFVWTNVGLTQVDLLVGVYATITVLISFGAVLGVVSAAQLLLIAFFEIILYSANILVGQRLGLYAKAPWSTFGFGGDSTYVHVFGAYFGLALAVPLGMRVQRHGKGKDDRADSYNSDMFSMIGTVFLWVHWPSFNAALVPAEVQHRVIVNSVLALCASCVFAFLGSRVFRGGKFDMADIQSATLAGGVAIGNGAAIVVGPGSALIIGAVAAIVSTLGSAYAQPLLQKAGVIDTRGVHNMHGLPGLIGTIASIVAIAIAFNDNPDNTVYGQDLNKIFPLGQITAGWQLLELVFTLLIAIVGGLVIGGIMAYFTSKRRRLFADDEQWRVPSDYESFVEEDDGAAKGGDK